MKPASLLLLVLLLCPGIQFAQTRQSEGQNADFWNRFEKGMDRFMKTLFDDFTPDRETAAEDTVNVVFVTIIRSDTTVSAGDTLRGNILVDHATLTLAGVIDGDLTARGGDIRMRSGARITGNVRLRETTLTRDEEAVVVGTLDQRNTGMLEQHGGLSEPSETPWFSVYPFRRSLPWMNETWTTTPFFVRYNRVEGLFLGLGSAKKFYWDGERDFSGFGSVGYGFVSHRWRGNLGVTRQFAVPGLGGGWLFEAGVEGYSLTDTKDPWIIGQTENSASAFFLREDYRDYFEREGFTTHLAAYYRNSDLYAEGKIAFLADRHASLDDRASWSLFGGNKTFRTNPIIDDGRMRSLFALVGLSTANVKAKIPSGWNVFASAEIADPAAFGGEFDFQRYVLELRRYQQIGRYDRLNFRLRAGTGRGFLPRQKSFDLGGPGTLPAFGFASLPGDTLGANRMILVNGEYLINGDVLHDLSFWPSWLMRHVNLIFLADAGFVRNVGPSVSPLSGFGGIGWNDFRSDLGVGVSNVGGSVRAAVVWRTDRSEPARFVVRFSRPF